MSPPKESPHYFVYADLKPQRCYAALRYIPLASTLQFTPTNENIAAQHITDVYARINIGKEQWVYHRIEANGSTPVLARYFLAGDTLWRQVYLGPNFINNEECVNESIKTALINLNSEEQWKDRYDTALLQDLKYSALDTGIQGFLFPVILYELESLKSNAKDQKEYLDSLKAILSRKTYNNQHLVAISSLFWPKNMRASVSRAVQASNQSVTFYNKRQVSLHIIRI